MASDEQREREEYHLVAVLKGLTLRADANSAYVLFPKGLKSFS